MTYQSPKEVPLSDETNTEKPTPKVTQIAIFQCSRSRVLMNTIRVNDQESIVGYRLAFAPANNLEGHLTVDDLAALRAILDEAIRQGVSLTTHVFEDRPPVA